MRKFTNEEINKGYMEMSDINLAISHADFIYESEAMSRLGELYNEMGKKKSQNRAKEG